MSELAPGNLSVTEGTQAQQNEAGGVDAAIAYFEEGLKKADAAPAEEAPAEGEPAAEEEAKPEETRLDRAVNAAQKARSAAAKNRELRAKAAQYESQIAQEQRARHQAQQEAAQAREWTESLKRDAYGTLRKSGMTDEQIIAERLKEGSPEFIAMKASERAAAAEERVLRLERSLAQREHAVTRQKEESTFFEVAEKNEVLSQYPRKFLLSAVKQLGAELISRGYDPAEVAAVSPEDACRLLEQEFLSEKKSKVQAVLKSPTKTLTNKLATTRVTVPSKYDDMNEEQQLEYLARMVTVGSSKNT